MPVPLSRHVPEALSVMQEFYDTAVMNLACSGALRHMLRQIESNKETTPQILWENCHDPEWMMWTIFHGDYRRPEDYGKPGLIEAQNAVVRIAAKSILRAIGEMQCDSDDKLRPLVQTIINASYGDHVLRHTDPRVVAAWAYKGVETTLCLRSTPTGSPYSLHTLHEVVLDLYMTFTMRDLLLRHDLGFIHPSLSAVVTHPAWTSEQSREACKLIRTEFPLVPKLKKV